MDINQGQQLAEILRLQRWAGGNCVSAAKTFGLARGFETALNEESRGISEQTQTAAEDVLDDVEAGKQSSDGLSISSRLRRDRISETDFADVMRLCALESRFLDGIKAIVEGKGSTLSHVVPVELPEQQWFGSLHYIEIVDESGYTTMRRVAGVEPKRAPRHG